MKYLFAFLLLLSPFIRVSAESSNMNQTKDHRLPEHPQKKRKAKRRIKSDFKTKTKFKKPLAQRKKNPPQFKELIPPPEPQKGTTDVLYPEQLGEHISTAVVVLANRLDSFFGTPRSDDENNNSTLRLTPSYTISSDNEGGSEFGVNLNLKLKNLEEKQRDFEETIKDEILTTTGMADNSPAAPTPQRLRYGMKDEPWRTNFESRLTFRPAPFVGGTFRIRKNFNYPLFINRFAATFGWDMDERFTQGFEFVTDSLINTNWLFRFQNNSKWFITHERLTTQHSPMLLQTLNKYNSLSYRVDYSFLNEGPYFKHTATVYSVTFRNSTPSKLIFFDIIPAYTYALDNDFREVRSIKFQLEYFFGNPT